MPKLSLTDFVDVVVRSGGPKITKVSTVKHRPAYTPAQDFYKIIREALAETHRNGKSKAHLQQVLGSLTDPKKQVNYPAVVSGYTKWWGRKTFQWFDPPSAIFSHSGIDVVINPELGLEFGGQRHVIKLYFKGDVLTKSRVDLITCLMEHTLRSGPMSGVIFSVLDTRSSKLISGSSSSLKLIAGLQAELAYIASLWPQV